MASSGRGRILSGWPWRSSSHPCSAVLVVSKRTEVTRVKELGIWEDIWVH